MNLVSKLFDSRTKIKARYVVKPNFTENLEKIENKFSKYGFNIKFQPQRFNGKVLKFSRNEIEKINNTKFHNDVYPESYYGRKCKAGICYLRVDVNGNVFQCNEFKKKGYKPLFNIISKSINVPSEPVKCPSSGYCCANADKKKMLINE